MIDLQVRQRFARVVTDLVMARPGLWRVLRRPFVWMFDSIASDWEEKRVSPQHVAPLEAALAAVPGEPSSALDIGTGTGAVARLLSERWPDAEVTGVDVSRGMIAEARRLGSERYDVGDASALPYENAAFDLVTQNNMIPFFDELARVTAPGGYLAIAYSMGPQTPIWVPLERVRAELQRRGFLHVADFEAGGGVALLARRS